jgi:prepilin-type N-terminal cleavage/methylation domain-containing protein
MGTGSSDPANGANAGFSLIEVLVAMAIMSVGVIALVGAIGLGARRLTGSQDEFIATQRASEAIESVFKARDNRVLTWAQIRNIAGASGTDGGIFQDGPQPVRDAGADGLANTADDGAVAEVIKPGPDGLLGTADDEHVPLFGFTREVEIRDLSANLRQVRIIMRYRTPQGQAQYVLTTYISAYA